MAIESYKRTETRFYISRINRSGQEETLRHEQYNGLPVAIRDNFESGKGFVNAQTANQGVSYFNSVELEKGDTREYWYFREDRTNTTTVVLNENSDPKIVEHFNNKSEREKELPTG